MEQSRPPSQKLPAGLAGVLNDPEEKRDSAYYSSIDPASKHNSTMSNNGGAILASPSSGYPSSTAENTPSPVAANVGVAPPMASPGASAPMSVASMVSPTSAHSEPGLQRRFDHPMYELGPAGAGLPPSLGGDPDSRRESINSQLGQNFNDLRLANSPYHSNNQSTTSIQSSLAQQRNPGSVDRNSGTRFSNSYQPNRLSDTLSPRAIVSTKTAPIITGPVVSKIARASEPMKGQAWAFPEEELPRIPSASRDSRPRSRQGTSFLDSRRSSIADSIASSQYTTESRLPVGQRTLDEGMPDYPPRLSRASSEFQGASHHHHSLQHKQIGDLQEDDEGSPGSSQPYSRTPELRVSHKLAERKRRTEMKELFDTLRDLMPQERGSKASKWEILTKAIAEHKRLDETIMKLDSSCRAAQNEVDSLRRENNSLRQENSQLRSTQPAGPVNGIPQINHPPHPPTDSYPSHYRDTRMTDQYPVRPVEQQLPPLRAINGMQANPDSMSDVQYQNEPPRTNGFAHRY